MIKNFLTLGGELHNPNHDHIAELLHDDETFLAFAWASSACMAKKRMVLGQCEKVMFNQDDCEESTPRTTDAGLVWLYIPVYTITIDASFCENSNDRDFCTLMEHELYHMVLSVTKMVKSSIATIPGLPPDEFHFATHDVEKS